MIDFSQTEISKVITHYVGNKLREEGYKTSDSETNIDDSTLPFFLKYIFSPFKTNGYFQFTHSVDLAMNEVYQVVSKIFLDPTSFIEESKSIAILLYGSSMHPKIKSGELTILYLRNLVLEDELTDAVLIVKSEEKNPFLQFNSLGRNFEITHAKGINLNEMDRACIIFNTEKQTGFKLSLVEGTNKSVEVKYWHNDFLQIEASSDSFHQTNSYLKLTKDFINNQLTGMSDFTKSDKADLLNRSIDFFKTNNDFDEKTFAKEVFDKEDLIDTFIKFKQDETKTKPDLPNGPFQISESAVKNASRNFKSVIKLDKNFHLYVHGDKKFIEKGYDDTVGKKYYKIYFDNES